MLELYLVRNEKVAKLKIKEDSVQPYELPILEIYLGGHVFSIPLDTLRGLLNQLEMMTNVSR